MCEVFNEELEKEIFLVVGWCEVFVDYLVLGELVLMGVL